MSCEGLSKGIIEYNTKETAALFGGKEGRLHYFLSLSAFYEALTRDVHN